MGRIIQKNNGKTTVYVTGENINNIPVSANTYYVGVDVDGEYKLLNPTGGTTNFNGGGVSVVDVTYAELVTLINTSGLTVGNYYLITNFRTCYDQPDYNSEGSPITIGNYKQGPVEPLMVFAIDINAISTTAYQPAYPNDRIQYDWTWDMTEITEGVAYGRITERIDEYNNRTDYDHRNIYFKRYTTYFYDMNNPEDGTIEILDNTGAVTGTSTNFTSFNIGNVIKVNNGLNYQIVAISGDTEMYVTGLTINTGSNLTYYLTYAQSDNDGSDLLKSYDFMHNNVLDTEARELPTFRFQWELDNYELVTSRNNYIGNHSNFRDTNLSHSYFLLANNTFSLYSYSNTLGDRCYNNSSYTWFNRNKISGSFYNNSMWRGFYANVVGEYCNNNLFGSYTWRNKIGENFEFNKTFDDFQNNIINNSFNNNNILKEFYKNNIENGFNDNLLFADAYGNLIGNGFNNNYIYTPFYDNQIGDYFEDNNLGNPINPNANDFYNNKIGVSFVSNIIANTFNGNIINNDFQSNQISGITKNNVIGNVFEFNTIIQDSFENNKIANEFKGNVIYSNFTINTVNSFVGGNNFSGETYDNKIGSYTFDNDFYGNVGGNTWVDGFYQNAIGNDFSYNIIKGSVGNNTIGQNFRGNEIGDEFNGNTIGDNFGNGNGEPRGNKIGNNFYENIIGEYFYNNSIPDNFYHNTIGDYFQWNIINTKVDYVNFTTNLGNITGFTYTATGSTAVNNGLYTAIGGSTDGNGVNANFWVNVSGGEVVGISGLTPGSLYLSGDVITILGSSISGNVPNDNITITVTGISETPIAYEVCTKQIFENKNNDKRISFYDENDVLTIEPIISNSVLVYSQALSFPINNTSMNFECDGLGLGEYVYADQTVNNMSELVSLFNNWGDTNKNGFYFDNGDDRLGVYISQALKNNLCPTGVITMNVFND